MTTSGFTNLPVWDSTFEKINLLTKKYGDGRSRARVVEMMAEEWEKNQDAKHKQADSIPFEQKSNVG